VSLETRSFETLIRSLRNARPSGKRKEEEKLIFSDAPFRSRGWEPYWKIYEK